MPTEAVPTQQTVAGLVQPPPPRTCSVAPAGKPREVLVPSGSRSRMAALPSAPAGGSGSSAARAASRRRSIAAAASATRRSSASAASLKDKYRSQLSLRFLCQQLFN